MKRIKNKLASVMTKDKVHKVSKVALRTMVEYAIALMVVVGVTIVVLKAPEVHGKYIRTHVGEKVYMIRDNTRSGGGTGFAVKAPSGQNYILTNDHVCGVSKDGVTVLVTGDEGSMRRRIISHDENSDLCLIEGMPAVEGLDVAGSGPSLGDDVAVVGHPRLMPKHLSRGEITGAEDVTVGLGPISVFDPKTGKEEQVDPKYGGILPEQCAMAKNSQIITDMDMMFFVLKVKFCAVTVKNAYVTGIVIYPGNSGSPVVNFWGNVVGVVFASDSTNWGRLVPIQDVKSFLRNY